MARVVNTNNPGKRRNHAMRSCAELLRFLSQKPEIDDESRDMLAAMVFALREIDASIDEAAVAWEKRDYWMKAEQFREKWTWVAMYCDELTILMRAENWAAIPAVLMRMLPYFAEIKINKQMRFSDLWEGKYRQFLQEQSR
jgi:hypothetical protein